METTIVINNRKFTFSSEIRYNFSQEMNYIKFFNLYCYVTSDKTFLEYITEKKLGYVTEGAYSGDKVVWIPIKKKKIDKIEYKFVNDSYKRYGYNDDYEDDYYYDYGYRAY